MSVLNNQLCLDIPTATLAVWLDIGGSPLGEYQRLQPRGPCGHQRSHCGSPAGPKRGPKDGAVCQLQRICRSRHVLRNHPDEPPKVFEPFLTSKAWWLGYCHPLTARYCHFSKLWVRWATPRRPRGEYRPHGGVMH
ncbi:hypothetical protein ASPFODRAFT_614399 [Aspergillus luchuensis CBS 106.47]|uniref:Uncharacterized protein n=1 Tax=Aspergillus luchuensis (strain CBS 106.47) TaxID=1137211 RepID=A0A1M3TJH9_ASPLC|nr:hypothetical protein ASPFODRAFT_614399 [Aspergillus luchuensis CBS 106.47]